MKACKITLKGKQSYKKTIWMTNKIFDMLENGRVYIGRDMIACNSIHTSIRRNIREAEEEWYKEIFEEMEALVAHNDIFTKMSKSRYEWNDGRKQTVEYELENNKRYRWKAG